MNQQTFSEAADEIEDRESAAEEFVGKFTKGPLRPAEYRAFYDNYGQEGMEVAASIAQARGVKSFRCQRLLDYFSA